MRTISDAASRVVYVTTPGWRGRSESLADDLGTRCNHTLQPVHRACGSARGRRGVARPQECRPQTLSVAGADCRQRVGIREDTLDDSLRSEMRELVAGDAAPHGVSAAKRAVSARG